MVLATTFQSCYGEHISSTSRCSGHQCVQVFKVTRRARNTSNTSGRRSGHIGIWVTSTRTHHLADRFLYWIATRTAHVLSPTYPALMASTRRTHQASYTASAIVTSSLTLNSSSRSDGQCSSGVYREHSYNAIEDRRHLTRSQGGLRLVRAVLAGDPDPPVWWRPSQLRTSNVQGLIRRYLHANFRTRT